MEKFETSNQLSEYSFSFPSLKCAVSSKVKGKREKKRQLKGRDYRRLVEKVEKVNKKVEITSEKNPEKGLDLVRNIKWERVLQRVQGEVVKDNVTILKKALKKKEITKERRKKRWSERQKAVEEKMTERQNRRKRNIEKKIKK